MPDAHLPVDAEKHAPPGAPSPVLLVDDEKDFADALAFRLQAHGIPALVAYRGEEALAALERPELEVVLLDLNMPGLPGLETLRRIKAGRPDVEVVLLTGEARLAVAARGMRRGAGDYVLKPVDFEALLASLAKARQRAADYRERQRAAEAGKLIALGSLAAGVGHEINNPLQVIIQSAEWLQELVEDASHGEADFPGMAEAADIIKKQAARMGKITAHLLDLAYRSRTNQAETDLPALIRKVIEAQAERAARLGVDISADVASDLPLLPCSPAELEPVLHHLLQNSLDAIEALHGRPEQQQGRGHVRVSAARAGDMAGISVEDTGEGIAPEHAPHVFDPFFSTRPVGRGTGLGLTVCHSIIYALRGRMRFGKSASSGAGTLFTVELPTTRGAGAAVSRPEPSMRNQEDQQ